MPFVKYIGQNDAIAQLEGAINSSATTIILKAWHGARLASTFPFLATLRHYDTDGSVLKREIVKVTARTDDTLTVVRHFEDCRISDTAWAPSSVSSTFDTDDYISMDITAWLLDDIQDEVTRIVAVDLPLKLNKATYDAERSLFGASIIGTDAYKITSSDVVTYVNGQTFKIQADVANTGACTLELNSLGAKAIEKLSSGAFVALATGDIVANQIFWATYNSVEDCFQFSVDPATTSVATPSASDTVEGIVERLTNAEALLMADTTRYASAYHLGLIAWPLSSINLKTHRFHKIMPRVWPTADAIANGFSEFNAILTANQWGGDIVFFDTSASNDGIICSNIPGTWSQPYMRFADIWANPIYAYTRIKFGTTPSSTEAMSWGFWYTTGSGLWEVYNSADWSIRFCLDDNTGDKLYAVTGDGSNNKNTNVTGSLTLTNWINLAMVITSAEVIFYASEGAGALTEVARHIQASSWYIPTTANNMAPGWGIQNNGSWNDMYITPMELWLPLS